MPRFLLLFLLPLSVWAQTETPAQANKRLFDRTVDELNFRTFETVYDKHYTRQKFPENLRTAAARRQFDQFENNAELKKLFQNYNGVAERYKNRFGNGPLTLAEFQKQLNGILVDRNFEFFIRGLPRDEKSALIRAEQRLIRQATAQFNASAEPVPAEQANTPPAEAEQPVASAPLTTNVAPADADDPTAAPTPGEAELRRPAEPVPGVPAAAGTSSRSWVEYLTLLLSLGSFLLLLYIATSLLGELRRLRAQVRALENSYAEPDYPPAPDAASGGFFGRFRREASGELPADSYDEDPEN